MRVSPRRSRFGFTLIELLVVISIIALLVSLLLPALSKVKATQQLLNCSTRMRGQFQSLAIYQADYSGFGPHRSPVATNGTDFNNPSGAAIGAGYAADGFDGHDPISGMAIWGHRPTTADAPLGGNAVGIGQVIVGGYLTKDLAFCPGMQGTDENTGIDGGGKFRRWEYRTWTFDDSVQYGFLSNFYTGARLARSGGMGGYNSSVASPASDANNYMIRSSYAYRSGDYSYVTQGGGPGQPLDTCGQASTATGVNTSLTTFGFPATFNGTGIHGRALAGPDLAKPDNDRNDSRRAILSEAFMNQHNNYAAQIANYGAAIGDSTNVAYADGSVRYRRDINQVITGVSNYNLNYNGAPFNTGTMIWSGGGTSLGAKGFYFDEDTARRNRRRGGDRLWQAANPNATGGNYIVGGGGVAGARTSIFCALDLAAKIQP